MEISCGTIFFGAILFFIGYIFWIQIKESHSSKLYNERRRKEGRAFPVILLITNKPHGRITFENEYLEIFGRPLVDEYLGFLTGDRRVKFHMSYSDLKDCVTYKQSRYSGGVEVVKIRTNRNEAICLEIKKPGDGYLIESTIQKHIQEYSRKIELQKLIRARFRAGIIDDVSPNDFEKLIGELFTFMGYSVIRTGRSGDGGIDLSCRNQKGEYVVVQCKRQKGNVGVEIVRGFYGALIHSGAVKGIIVCTSKFTNGATDWIESKPIELIDKKRLSELLMTYYR